jgi:glycine/D-amino acid oxidase-like deaminating enzyme
MGWRHCACLHFCTRWCTHAITYRCIEGHRHERINQRWTRLLLNRCVSCRLQWNQERGPARPATRTLERPISIDIHESIVGSKPQVYWTDDPDAPERTDPLVGVLDADLVVVGAGFSGLWAAIQAVTDAPGRSVIVVEADTAGFGASSRNGGFLEASLTHGIGNGVSHWPAEFEHLESLGKENLKAITSFIKDNDLDVGLEETGAIGVATKQWHIDEIHEAKALHQRYNQTAVTLDRHAMSARVTSPTYLGGLYVPDGTAIVNPARLAWGLRRIAEKLGVVINDDSPVSDIEESSGQLVVTTPRGSVRASKVIVATNAYRSPIGRMRRLIVPVYDYVLMTEPLTTQQMASIGWEGREGLADLSSQFHYYRLTTDNRILWGGYDAIYRFRNAVGEQYDQAGSTHQTLAEHFFETFPQLEGVTFTHRWGGPIATTSQFTATWGTSHGGNLSWVGGYTGLGVGATRFGARVALDLVDGRASEYTDLEMVRKQPMAFPPEPLRYAGIQMTRKAIARSDARGGRRGLWLKALDRIGVGFDS